MSDSTQVALWAALLASLGVNVVAPIAKWAAARVSIHSKITEVQLTIEEQRETRLMTRIGILEHRIDEVLRDRDECKADLAEALGRIARLEGSSTGGL